MRQLPPFPWDRLASFSEQARQHPDGIVDLSVGSPVDPVPRSIRTALTKGSDRPGYPLTAGTPKLRAEMDAWVRRHCGVTGQCDSLPTIGSKEAVANLPWLLGVGNGQVVAIPRLAYPTYEVGARLAGARSIRVNDPAFGSEPRLRMIWVNYPSNPTGEVFAAERLRKVVTWARSRGITVVSDECYLSLGWESQQVSILHPDVCGPEPTGVLALHSLSKRSNLAGYRAAMVSGDPALVDGLRQLRKNAGFIVPAPVQDAMATALRDEQHANEQRERYRDRRSRLWQALERAGFRIEHSKAGLYLWATRDEDCWDTVKDLAASGIVVAPGEFYGPAGVRHVRVALTATDERVNAACQRLSR